MVRSPPFSSSVPAEGAEVRIILVAGRACLTPREDAGAPLSIKMSVRQPGLGALGCGDRGVRWGLGAAR